MRVLNFLSLFIEYDDTVVVKKRLELFTVEKRNNVVGFFFGRISPGGQNPVAVDVYLGFVCFFLLLHQFYEILRLHLFCRTEAAVHFLEILFKYLSLRIVCTEPPQKCLGGALPFSAEPDQVNKTENGKEALIPCPSLQNL